MTNDSSSIASTIEAKLPVSTPWSGLFLSRRGHRCLSLLIGSSRLRRTERYPACFFATSSRRHGIHLSPATLPPSPPPPATAAAGRALSVAVAAALRLADVDASGATGPASGAVGCCSTDLRRTASLPVTQFAPIAAHDRRRPHPPASLLLRPRGTKSEGGQLVDAVVVDRAAWRGTKEALLLLKAINTNERRETAFRLLPSYIIPLSIPPSIGRDCINLARLLQSV